MAPSVAVVCPSNRPEMFRAWYEAWRPHFDETGATVILVEDADELTTDLLDVGLHICRRHVPSFVPTGTGAIRSAGFLAAWRAGYDIVVTMDDDCLPSRGSGVITEFLRGFKTEYPASPYFDIGHIFGIGHPMRGMPDAARAKPLIQYGGWDGVPDWGADYQKALRAEGNEEDGYHFDRKALAVPVGIPFTGCIMNAAFTREAIPMMYQLVMGMDRVGYDRWDDIWSGLIAKKICDHLGMPIVINGHATVRHSRASDPDENARKEAGGIALNEIFWSRLSEPPAVGLPSSSPAACYEWLAHSLPFGVFGKKGRLVVDGMRHWIKEFR